MIPIDLQIEAILEGGLQALIEKYHGSVSATDALSYITVSRADLERVLHERPHLAARYFSRLPRFQADADDVTVIERTDNGFVGSMLDHGRRRFQRHFPTLVEAVAEHVLRRFGKPL